MVDITFLLSVSEDGISAESIEYPTEYIVASGFFFEEDAVTHQSQVNDIYDFLIGKSDDWEVANQALSQSRFYDPALVFSYLSGAFFPSTNLLRTVIVEYAKDHFTSAMLLQEDSYSQ